MERKVISRKLVAPKDIELDSETIQKYIDLHEVGIKRYEELEQEYYSLPPILDKDNPEPKPNNKLVVSHGRYLQTNFDGFTFGKEPRLSNASEKANEKLQEFIIRNNFRKVISQMAKMTSIYGEALVLFYQDEDANTRCTWLNPKDAFVVYDDTADSEKLFGVTLFGDKVTISTHAHIIDYEKNSEGKWAEVGRNEHPFSDIPLVEFLQNEERMGLYESVLSLINAYNTILSAKVDDIEYFADAYLHIDTEKPLDLKQNRDFKVNRVINTYGGRVSKVGFLERPSSDQTQENALNRIEEKIFQVSNVVDMSKDNGSLSGEARKTRLQEMTNQALNKQSEFEDSIREAFELFYSVPTNGNPEDYLTLDIQFYLNLPNDIEKESQIARNLKGIVSDETILRLLSFVDDPAEELEKLDTTFNFPSQRLGE